MEEDIKILEEVVNYRRIDGIYSTNEVIFKAIENLIKECRQLKEENAMLKKANSIAENVKVDDLTQAMYKSYEEFMKQYIPKSKLEQRKQELEYDQLENPKNICENRIKIECIKELMGGE